MDPQRPPTRKDRMMRRDVFPLNELEQSAEERWIGTVLEQHSSLVNESNEPPSTSC
jgi:hypothetical protein